MNFEDLYTIKTKLERIYSRLEEINDNKYDSSGVKKAFKMIDSLLERYDDVPNSINTGTQVKAQNKEITNLLKLTDSLGIYVDKLYNSFRIFTDIKSVQELYSKKKPSKEEFNECLKVILNDLIDYKFLITQGNFTTDRFDNELAPTLYKLILDEAKFNGSYTILNTLENMNIDTRSIERLLNEDVLNLIDNEDIKNELYKLDSKVFKNAKMNRNIILIVSTYKDNYKLELESLFKNRLKDIKYAKEDYDEYLSLKKKAEKNNKKARKELSKAKKGLREQIIPIILSISVLIGANIGINGVTKNFKHKTGESYSTVEGYTDYDEYDIYETKVGDVIVEVFGDKSDNGSRSYKKYVISDLENPTLDLDSLELSDDNLVKTYKNYEGDSLSDSAYTNIAVIENVEKDEPTYVLAFALHLLMTTIWAVIDLAMSVALEVGDVGVLFPFKENYEVLKNGIDYSKKEIELAKEYLYRLEDGRTYSKEELKKKKEYLETLINEYNKLLNDYSHLTEVIGIEKTLKL